jgi:Na+/H+ antiporter NhaD/arsenite permease-like protein
MKLTALLIFGLTYLLLLMLPKYRAYVALISATVFVVLGIVPMDKVFAFIDWNVLMMIAGTMGVVSLFIESKMPSLLADIIIDRMPNVKWAIIALALFAGIISAFVDNVATVLMVAPVALTIAKKLNISPVNSVIAIAISSNLQGAATLVGDTTSILLGGYAKMNFLDFFWYQSRPSMFWVVQIGAILSTITLLWLFRKDNQPIAMNERTEVTDFFPTYLLLGTIVLLIVASFLPNMPKTINGLICISLFIIGMLRNLIIRKNFDALKLPMMEIDYFTIMLLGGLFVVIGGISEVGVINDISKLFI